MEQISTIANIQDREDTSPVVDTSFVLFFLAVEIGQNIGVFGIDTIFMFVALIAVGALPYFLIEETSMSYSRWLLGRGAIVGFAILLGLLFKQSLGSVFPQAFGFLPFTFLILTAMLSCYIQFYGFLRFRLSR